MAESSAAMAAEKIKAGRPSTGKHDAEQQRTWRNQKRRAKYQRRQTESREHAEPETERGPYVPSEESIVLASVLGNTVWNLSRMFSHHRALTKDEQHELGAALDPVLYKWLPALDDWKAEATLLMVTWMLWNATAPPPLEDSENGDQGEGDGARRPAPRGAPSIAEVLES